MAYKLPSVPNIPLPPALQSAFNTVKGVTAPITKATQTAFPSAYGGGGSIDPSTFGGKPLVLPSIPGTLGVPGFSNGGAPVLPSASTILNGGGGKASHNVYTGDETPLSLPDYIGLDTLGDKGKLSGKVGDIWSHLDKTGTDALMSRALDKGPSPWLKMALEKQGLEQTGLMNSASAMAAGANADARANLGMRGGLRGGAAERLASAGGNNLALARQGVNQQGALERSNLGMNDEATKTDLLKLLPGAQLADANYATGIDQTNVAKNLTSKQYDINNLITDLGGQNASKQLGYTEGMKLKGAGLSANAVANAGKK